MPSTYNKGGFQRRVIGYHGFRLDGLADILHRSHGASVFDVGCNRGMVAYEFALHGASVLHGCDNYAEGMRVANEVFADWRNVDARFETVDLLGGGRAIEDAFGSVLLPRYDIMLYLAVHHKLQRAMDQETLYDLVRWLADRCGTYFVWRGSYEEMSEIEPLVMRNLEFRRIHLSEISEFEVTWDGTGPEKRDGVVAQPAAIWKRRA